MGNYIFEHLNLFDLKHYSQTCSNDLLCKTTNAESTQANSRTIVMYKTAVCLTRTATTFFDLQMKKSLSKTTTTKLYPAKECKKKQGTMRKKYLSL